MAKATSKNAPLAAYAEKETTPVIDLFVQWIEDQTGYAPDPKSVMLGSALRGQFQKSDVNQKRIADAAAANEAAEAAREERRQERADRKAAREAAATAKANAPKAEKVARPAATKAERPARATAVSGKKSTGKASPATARRRPARPATAGDDSDF